MALPASSITLKFQRYANPLPNTPRPNIPRTGPNRYSSFAIPSKRYSGKRVIAARVSWSETIDSDEKYKEYSEMKQELNDMYQMLPENFIQKDEHGDPKELDPDKFMYR